MTLLQRRLERLEAQACRQESREIDAMLASLADVEVDFLASIGERILAGEAFEALPAEMRNRFTEILASWERGYLSKEDAR